VRSVCYLAGVVLLGLLTTSSGGQAQQSAGLQAFARAAPTKISKTELAVRFQDLKTQYAATKSMAGKFVPLKPDSLPELRVVRSKISAGMRSYELTEAQAQKQRDKLNLLTELSEADSARLQSAMDRLAKMSAMIRKLMKGINESGDTLVMNVQ